MRIWLIAENWPPRVGGIERYLVGLAEHLVGHEVTVIAPLVSTPSSPPSYEGEKSTLIIRKRFFWSMWPKWFPLFLSLKKQAQKEKPDVIICGKALAEGRIAHLLKKSLGIPYVVCTYGMEIATWSNTRRTKAQLQHVLQNADAVLFINEQTKQELLALGVLEKNLFALYPGIDTKKLSQINTSEDVLQKYNITKPYILSVARLVKRKGIDDLITAFAKLEENHLLVVVGDGPERKSLEKLVKKLNANVVFLGQIPDEDVHVLYTHAQLFALTPKELPGDYEGFGIVYIEAAFFGLCTLGTQTGGVAMAVQHGVTGILAEPGNIASIQEALHKITTDPTLAKQYGQAGKQRVTKEFLWEENISKLNRILKDIPI